MTSNHLEQLRDKLKRYFDFLPESEMLYGDLRFDIAARSNIRNEAYLLFKSAVMYAFENNELCFVKALEELDNSWIDRLEAAMLEAAERHVVPSEEHMSTVVTGVFLTSGPVAPEIKRKVERYRKQQSYWLGLKGWTSFRIILIETESQTVTASKEAKKAAKFFCTIGTAEVI